MGCLDLLGLQNLAENVSIALYLILLLLAVFCINIFYWIVLRVSSCVLPPCLTLVRWSLQSVAMANVIAACIGIPHDIFLHTHKYWHLESGICTFIVVIDCWYHTGLICILLFCTADRFTYYKFPPLYKRFTQRTSWMVLALLLTWLIAVVFSLPIAASVSNGNGGHDTDCDPLESSHKVCRPFSDAGMAAYQFMALFLLPTGFSVLLIVITWKAEFSGALSKHKPKEITLHNMAGHFLPVGGRYRSEVSDEEFHFDDDPEEQNLKIHAQRYIETNTDLLTNLPPATTRFTTLPRLDSAARLHIQRMQLESRASTIGDCSDRISSPAMEAWPDDYHGAVSIYGASLEGGRNVSSPVAASGCNLSLSSRQMQSPQPPLRDVKSPPPTRSITPMDGVSVLLSGSSHALTSAQDEVPTGSLQEVTKGIRPFTPALTPVERYAEHSHTHSGFAKFAPRPYSREGGGAHQHNQREKQRLARLRQKWKKSSLKQNAALPPIAGGNKIDPNHGASNYNAKEDMQDLTVPFCEKTAFKLVALNVLLLLGLRLPLELGHVISSSCVTCHVPITLWNFIKSLTHVFALLSPLVSCYQHPALNHTSRFLLQYLKKSFKPSNTY